MGSLFWHGEMVPGTQYRVIGQIGAGGHGIVYAVEHTFLEAPAVMKLLHADLVARSTLASRMTREARTLAKLRHPNIVEIRDGGITSERVPRPYIVMERLRGYSLRDALERIGGVGIGVLHALDIATSVLLGLEYAHRTGVVHRDIKPDNVFLHKTHDVEVPKILDFGTAHLVRPDSKSARHFIGTPRWAAPEQLAGEEPTPSADIYAVGLVLYQLLTGEQPFARHKTIDELRAAHRDETLPPVSDRVAGMPRALDRFLATMLAKDPAARPPTACAAAVHLRELRAMIEARQARSLQTPEFKTDPTPMANLLAESARSSTHVIVVTDGPRHIGQATVSSRPRTPVVRTPTPTTTSEREEDVAEAVPTSRATPSAKRPQQPESSRATLTRARRALLAVAVALVLVLASCVPFAIERLR